MHNNSVLDSPNLYYHDEGPYYNSEYTTLEACIGRMFMLSAGVAEFWRHNTSCNILKADPGLIPLIVNIVVVPDDVISITASKMNSECI